MMEDAENQTDKQKLLVLLANTCSYCDQASWIISLMSSQQPYEVNTIYYLMLFYR